MELLRELREHISRSYDIDDDVYKSFSLLEDIVIDLEVRIRTLEMQIENKKEQQRPEWAMKPCPFCRSEDVVLGFNSQYYVFCNGCLAGGPSKTTEGEACIAWNTRPIEDALSAAVMEIYDWYRRRFPEEDYLAIKMRDALIKAGKNPEEV